MPAQGKWPLSGLAGDVPPIGKGPVLRNNSPADSRADSRDSQDAFPVQPTFGLTRAKSLKKRQPSTLPHFRGDRDFRAMTSEPRAPKANLFHAHDF
jgi:hypothetical protein